MPYTLEDYRREVMRENWAEMSLEERSALLKDLPPAERLQGLSESQIEAYLKALRAQSDSNGGDAEDETG